MGHHQRLEFAPIRVDPRFSGSSLNDLATRLYRGGAPGWVRLVTVNTKGDILEGPTQIDTLMRMIYGPQECARFASEGDEAREVYRQRHGGLLTPKLLYDLAKQLLAGVGLEQVVPDAQTRVAIWRCHRDPPYVDRVAAKSHEEWLSRLDKTEDGRPFNLPMEREIFTRLDPLPRTPRQFAGTPEIVLPSKVDRPRNTLVAWAMADGAANHARRVQDMERQHGAIAYGSQITNDGRRLSEIAPYRRDLRERWERGEFSRKGIGVTDAGTSYRMDTGEVVDDP